jgi:hypothetical protein
VTGQLIADDELPHLVDTALLPVLTSQMRGGVLGGNAVPHFVRGITKQRYPNIWSGGPVPNLERGSTTVGRCSVYILYGASGAAWYRFRSYARVPASGPGHASGVPVRADPK